MKKYSILLGLGSFIFLFSPIKAHATDVFGFMDGKFYNGTGDLLYTCFLDGSCYGINMQPAPFKLVPANQPISIAPSPTDVCPNIEGVQTVVPLGMILSDGNCIIPPAVGSEHPVAPPFSQSSNLSSPYTEAQIAFMIGCRDDVIPGIYNLTSTSAYIRLGCIQGGQYEAIYKHLAVSFNNQVLQDGSSNNVPIDNLIPNTKYSYTITYHEYGRQDTVINKSFTTLE